MSKPGHVIFDVTLGLFRCKYCGDQSDPLDNEVSTARLEALAKGYGLYHGQCEAPAPVDDQPDLPNTTPAAIFDSHYPLARTIGALRLTLERVLEPDHWLELEGKGWVPVGAAEMTECAQWARVELAHLEGPSRPPIAGMTTPTRFAMPECIAKFKPKPAKRGKGATARDEHRGSTGEAESY